MHIRVDLLPAPPYDDVVVLIDVLRTGTVAPLLFERGLSALHVATKLKLARALGEQRGAVLIGERKGVPPEGFNYGNSPAQLSGRTFKAKEAVLVSENAPSILPLVDEARHVLLGSLYNAEALVRRALAKTKGHIYLVCCGLWGQEDLDDSLTAGFLAARLRALAPDAQLGGGARLALSLLETFPDPLEALWRSSSGHYLRHLNMADDIALASCISQSEHVPTLQESQSHRDGLLYTFRS